MAVGLTRVMIVDDEDVFRNHLKQLINWSQLGYLVCGEAQSGRAALESIPLCDPDIIISDIQMPEIDGMTLLAEVAARYPHIQTIALSGYDEYRYVRSSMKSGALDYLLKHQITPQGMVEALDSARNCITERRKKVIENRAMAEQAELGQSALRHSFLQRLLSGELDAETLPHAARAVNLAVDGGYFVLLVAEIDHMSSHKARYTDTEWMNLYEQAMRTVETVVEDAGTRGERVGLVLAKPESRFAALFSMPEGFSLLRFYNHIHTCVQNIRMALKTHYNLTACYSISANITSVGQIPTKYKEVAAKLKNKVYLGEDTVLQEQGTLAVACGEDVGFDVEDEKQIRLLLRAGDLAGLQERVDKLFERCRVNHVEPAQLQMIFTELLGILSRTARQEHRELRELLAMDGVYERLQYMTSEEMKQFFLEGCHAVIGQRFDVGEGDGHTVTRRAYAYIHRNYTAPISLADVADAVGVNPSYLGRVYKSDTGKTVVEQVNELRVEAAKQLLADGARPGDIAASLGFNSTSYFNTVFRQATGLAPTQYKKSVANQ